MSEKLQAALKQLEKTYGKGTILGGEEANIFLGEVISTGSLKLDLATGIMGLPRGRIVELTGPESTGKSTICLQTIASAQKMGLKVAYIDMEHAIDGDYARKLGVNMTDLLISQPDYGEQALNIAQKLTETGEVGAIVIDSVATLVPKSEIEGEIGTSSVGKQARMMSQALRILSPLAQRNNCLILFTNQIRMKIGVLYGSPETHPGGEAMKFYASIRIDLRKRVDKKEEKNTTIAKVIKNKMASPFKEAEFDIVWGEGINRRAEIIDLAVEGNIINKAGSWYSYKETRIGQGLDSVVQLLSDNPDLAEEIEAQVISSIHNPKTEVYAGETEQLS